MLCAGRRWFLGDLNQFPVAFHLRQTPLYILSQTSHLFQMIIHDGCVVMSPVFSGDVDALTPGRLLTESHLCGLTQESLLTPGSTHSPPHTGLATGHSHPHPETVVSTSGQCTQQLSHVGDTRRGWLSDTAGIGSWKEC